MADEPRVIELEFGPAVRGWGDLRPARSLEPEGEGPLWRDIKNMSLHDDYARRRQVLDNYSAADPWPQQISYDVNDGTYNQTPRWIWFDPTYGTAIVVTDREILRNNGTSWSNLTPVYDTGTIAATTGSGTVTGTGTAWDTRGIQAGNLIEIDSNWYRVTGVTNDTTLSITPNSSSTVSGASYQIRRSFPAPVTPPQCAVFNGDLYVAGNLVESSSIDVVKVTDVILGTGTGDFLVGTSAWEAGLDTLTPAGTQNAVMGVELLDDGRVVIGVFGTDRPARIYYSSHINQTVWSTSPGGFTDLVSVPGGMTALTKMGTVLYAHFNEGIAVGQPTGQDDPPLGWRPTISEVGSAAPRMVAQVGSGQQAFLGWDYNAYIFDGQRSILLPDVPRTVFEEEAIPDAKSFVNFDRYRRDFCIWHDTHRWVYNLERNQWTGQDDFGVEIGGASNDVLGLVYVGVSSYDSGQSSDSLYALRYADGPDDDPHATTPTLEFYLETDDTSVRPRDITVDYVGVEIKGNSTQTEEVTVSVSYNSGKTWDDLTKTVSVSLNNDQTVYFTDFTTSSGEKFRVRVTMADDGDIAAMVGRVKVGVAAVNETIAVQA